MRNNKEQYSSKYDTLASILQSQQSVPQHYNPRDYFGSCMRVKEDQTADFLGEFVDDIVIIQPEHFELFEKLLYVSKHSKYKPIKELLPIALEKFNAMKEKINMRQAIAEGIAPVNSNATGAGKYSVLENKKKMLMMSCSNICTLGDAINGEREFDTKNIKNKFMTFVSYRIELVLSGKMPADSDFNVLLNRYGTQQQIKRFSNMAANPHKMDETNSDTGFFNNLLKRFAFSNKTKKR